MLGLTVWLVAVAARVAHHLAIRTTPLADVLVGDARAYDAWAQRLAAGDWMGADVFYQAPLYPYFLGMLYAVFGHDLAIVRVAQALVGGTSAALLALATERLFGRRAAWAAGLGLALYAPAIFFDTLLQKTVLDVFFVCLLLWVTSWLVVQPHRAGFWVGLGAILGALSLTRENALALTAVALAWSLAPSPGPDTTPGPRTDKAPGRHARPWSLAPGRRLLAVGAGLALVLLPVFARNYAVTGGVYLTTAQFGPNFYIGNNPLADGTYMPLRPGRGAPEFEQQDATDLAQQALGRPLTPAAVSAYWRDRALQFISSNPGGWIALMGRKIALLWNRSEMLDTESQETYEEYSPLLRSLATIGHFGLLVPLACVGLVAAWPRRRQLWPVLAFGGMYALSVLVFYVFARYRFPLVPFLMLLAGAGVGSAREGFGRYGLAARVSAGVVIALITAVVNWPLLSTARMRAITDTNLGTALHERGRLDEAAARYEKALALQPDYAPAYNNLGVTLRAQGKVDAAIAVYERGLRVHGDLPDLHYNLANALLAQGRAEEAAAHLATSAGSQPDAAAARNNLGTALAAAGRFEEAAAEFRMARALEPGSILARRNLAKALAALGRGADALTVLDEARALAPADGEVNYDLGGLLLDAGRYAEAAACLRVSLAADPRSPRTLNNLGIALAAQGELGEAAALFSQALAIDPGFSEAQRNLDMARRATKR